MGIILKALLPDWAIVPSENFVSVDVRFGCPYDADMVRNPAGSQVTVVWDANRLRRSLMLTVLGWASSLHDPATYARSYPVHLPAPKPATTSAALLPHFSDPRHAIS